MNQKIKLIFLAFACIASFLSAEAKVTVKASLDSVNLLMGKLTTLNLEVVQDAGKPGGFRCSAAPTPQRAMWAFAATA